MGKNSNIEWCDHTVNFWIGCHKVSDGCKFCYMYRDLHRWKQDPAELKQVSIKRIISVLNNAQKGDKIFVNSWSDFFHENVNEWRKVAWEIISKYPYLNFLILTKRPENIYNNLPADWGIDGYPNVWLGVSVESEKYKDRILYLSKLKSKNSQFKTFVSCEPLLSNINFLYPDNICNSFSLLDWIIVGGESGNNAGKFRFRECKLSWIKNLILLSHTFGKPIFVKQLGSYIAKENNYKNRKGGNIDEFPLVMRFREFPGEYNPLSYSAFKKFCIQKYNSPVD